MCKKATAMQAAAKKRNPQSEKKNKNTNERQKGKKRIMEIAKERKVGACTRQERIPLTTEKMNLYPLLSHISFAMTFDKTSARDTVRSRLPAGKRKEHRQIWMRMQIKITPKLLPSKVIHPKVLPLTAISICSHSAVVTFHKLLFTT